MIIPLFSLGSIYSTNAGRAVQMPEIILIKLNRVKNPSCLEVNQLAVYMHGRVFDLGTTS